MSAAQWWRSAPASARSRSTRPCTARQTTSSSAAMPSTRWSRPARSRPSPPRSTMSRRRVFRSSPSPRGRCCSSTRGSNRDKRSWCATQMAKEAGASVYGTARARDVERVRALGAEPVVEGDGVGGQTAPGSLDAVIDTIGGDALESTCKALRPNGIIVSVVRAPDEAYVRSKGMRAAYFIVDVTRDRLDRISAMVEGGRLDLPVGEVLDLAEASIAHRMLDGAPHKPGKIVLKVAD